MRKGLVMNRSLRRLVCSAAVVGAACAAAQADDIMTIDSVQLGVWVKAVTQAYPIDRTVSVTVNSFPASPIYLEQTTASLWQDSQGVWTAYAHGEAWVTGRDYPGQNAFGIEQHFVSSIYASEHQWADVWSVSNWFIDFSISQSTTARVQTRVVDKSSGGSAMISLLDKSTGAEILFPSAVFEFPLAPGSYQLHFTDGERTDWNYVPGGFYGTSVLHFEVPTPGSFALLGGGLLMMSIRRR
jgi:hypothetical protein